MVTTTLRQLLEAGVHFGHQTGRWNPKMKPFIFAKRNGIYIIDLQRTRSAWQDALQFLEQEAAQGGKVLFVGTKRQAQNIIAEEAERCGQFYVNYRWLGGLLTNWQTISKSIDRYRDLEAMKEDGRAELLPKKEVLQLQREMFKLERNLKGIRDMGGLPDVVFVIDIRRERIAVDEAIKLGIPVVAIVDTNCDPEGIDYVVPGNDDAIRSIRLFCAAASDAISAGSETYEARVAEAERDRAEKAAAKQKAQAEREEAEKAAAKKARAKQDVSKKVEGKKAAAEKVEAKKAHDAGDAKVEAKKADKAGNASAADTGDAADEAGSEEE